MTIKDLLTIENLLNAMSIFYKEYAIYKKQYTKAKDYVIAINMLTTKINEFVDYLVKKGVKEMTTLYDLEFCYKMGCKTNINNYERRHKAIYYLFDNIGVEYFNRGYEEHGVWL